MKRQVGEVEGRIKEEVEGGRDGEGSRGGDGVRVQNEDGVVPRPAGIAPDEVEAQKEPQRESSETLVDEHEVVVEGDEDTVIY